MKFKFNWKTIVGAIFVLSGLSGIKEGIGTVIGAVIVGGALILWGMQDKDKPKKNTNDIHQPSEVTNSSKASPVLTYDIVVSESKGAEDDLPCTVHEKMYTIEKPRSKKRLQALGKGGYIVFDVETTGLSPHGDRIIDLALLRVDENGVQSCFSSLFNPGCHINSKIRKLTGICDEDVADAPHIEDKLQEIIDFIGELPLVAHNASFDGNFLSESLARAGMKKEFTMIDTLWLSRNAFPDMQNYKLATLIDAFHLSDGPQEHRAMGDVECTQKLFEICIEELLKQKEAELAARRAAKA